MKRLVLLSVVLVGVSCNTSETSNSCTTNDGGVCVDGGAADSGTDQRPGTCSKETCAGVCCNGFCLAPRGSCSSAADCQNDTYCAGGQCLPYCSGAYDEECVNSGFAPGALTPPTLKCAWQKEGAWAAPAVADLDGDGVAEIAVLTQDGHLALIRGDDCSEIAVVDDLALSTCGHLAMADVTGDGVPEIVAIDTSKRVVVFDGQGTVLATSEAALAGAAKKLLCTGPAIADLDGTSPPEIVFAGMALRWQGGALTTLYNKDVPVGGLYGVVISAVADVDLDGTPEIVTGNRILDGRDGQDQTPAAAAALPAGYPAIGQFDPSTPEPEVVLSAAGKLYIYHPVSGKVIFGPYSIGSQFGGPPTVADFDGDGAPEVGVAGSDGYYVFDPQCAATPLPAGCAQAGVRWFKVTQDHSSSSTGSSVFDFNGDGRAEVVYRDECWLRVYDGVDGTTRFITTLTNGTGTELPVIADTDHDQRADLVVTGTNWSSCPASDPESGEVHQGNTSGIFIFADSRWMPSRPIWNQHTYHITNVNEDGTVPLVEQNNWESWNNYRQNAQGTPKEEIPGADLTARWYAPIDTATDCQSAWVLQVELCNRGPAKVPPGVRGTFSLDAAGAAGEPLCSAETEESIEPGACVLLKCTWEEPSKESIDLYFAADDLDGVVECREQNNVMFEHFQCPGGPD